MSDFIEIDKKPVIFDDPDCCGDDKKECNHLQNKGYCSIFDSFIECNNFISIKCDECKTEWKTANKKQLKPCEKCKKPRGEDEHGAYICPCPHCGDEIPF